MTIRRLAGAIARFAVGVVVLAVVAFAAYEGYAIWRAEVATDEVRSAFLVEPAALRPSDLSPEQMAILLAVEDPAFHEHRGVDVVSPGQGLTTITQAITKFLYFEPFRPGFAKIEQSLIARFVVHRRFTKDEQLTILLNHAYFGGGDGKEVRGFTDGAKSLFGKAFGDLTRDEYIGLIGLLIGPNALRPDRNQAAYDERVARIGRLLAGACQPSGWLDVWYDGCAGAAD